jgi:DNA polymerase-1
VAIWPAPSAIGGSRPEFFGLALALMPGMAAYLPLGHRSAGLLDAAEGAGGLSLEVVIGRLKPLLEDPGVLKIGHDMKGAAHLLRR